MDKIDVSHLESATAELLAQYHALKVAHQKLLVERKSLIEKNQLAITRIKALLNRLKSVERAV